MTSATRITAAKAEWHLICRSMKKGSWNGTEAEALARIEYLKRTIANLEAVA